MLATNNLAENQKEQVKTLVELCKQYDGINVDLFLENDFDVYKDLNCRMCIYDNDTLISFLSIFAPSKIEAEIIAFTHPDYRRKGCFTSLLDNALEEIKKYGYKEILFLCDTNSKTAKIIMEKLKAKYEFSEYYMELESNFKTQEKDSNIIFSESKAEDVDAIAKISSVAFGNDISIAKDMLNKALTSEDNYCYHLMLNGEHIAFGRMSNDAGQVGLYGLAVIPEHRGNGYGKELMYRMIDEARKKNADKIILEVDSKNMVAYNLYKNNGFTSTFTTDYYRKEV